jgi:hypothetical protein
VVLPGCLDGPAPEAARRDLAAVYPGAGEYDTARGARRNRVYAGGQPGAIIALPSRGRAAARGRSRHDYRRIASAAGNAPTEIRSAWRSPPGPNCRATGLTASL